MITSIQFDPNGYCNGKCWFCPVRYESLPKHKNMKISDVEKILDKIVLQIGNEVDKNVIIYTAHYNEILLYPYLEKFLQLLNERNLKTVILSNGINLTQSKIKIIEKFDKIIQGICLNIPAIEKEQWIKQVGCNEKQYYKLIDNLNNLKKFKIKPTIILNGITKNWLIPSGCLSKLKNYPCYILDNTVLEQYDLFKEKYPDFKIHINSYIVDRNNILERHGIYSLRLGNLIHNKKNNDKIIGCNNGIYEYDGRFNNWLHINCNGDVFICCMDYFYEYSFGNLLNQSLADIWYSAKRQETIERAKKTICLNCMGAIYETGRSKSFTKIKNILNQTYKNPINIVETGCIRGIENNSILGDGWSTYHWMEYCSKTNSSLWSIDNNSYAINQTNLIKDKYFKDTKNLYVIKSDSIEFLKKFKEKIDLLFLDSDDNSKHQLNELKCAWKNLNETCFILIDDVFNEMHDGKGKFSIPYLLQNGFKLIYYIDNQVLLKR